MIKKFAAFGCVHVPFQSKQAHDWLLARLQEHKPDVVVCLGDLFEAGAASVHPNEYDHDLMDEFAIGSDYLRSIRDVVGHDKEFVWTLGNHDDNIKRADSRRIPKSIRRNCDWNNSKWSGEYQHWKQIDYRKTKHGCYQLGQVVFIHGYDAGRNSDENEALQFAYYLNGQSHRLVVRAHTHRPMSVTQCMKTASIPLPYWSANVGTMCDIPKMDYASRSDTAQWGSAVILGDSQVELNSPRVSRCWSAEVIVNKLGWQE